MKDEELLRPLWHYPLRWLTFARASARWSYLSDDERAERRASWSAGRRAVRPIGLCLYWAGLALFVVGYLPTTVRIIWLAALLPLAGIGLRDWLRDGRARAHTAAPVPRVPEQR
jgi:hypothetical protein